MNEILKNFTHKVEYDYKKIVDSKKIHFSIDMGSIEISDFKILEKIGEGNFGDVYNVIEKKTNTNYAAKISKLMVDEDMENQEEVKYLFREINIFSILDHPSILKFIGYSPINFEGDPTPTIVTEYAVNNSLQNVINQEIIGLSPTNWNFTKKLIVIYGVASGMSYLHSKEILHRDLKPANVFFIIYIYSQKLVILVYLKK